MTLNKTGIEWTDYTWNPVTGCLHNCPYCYARKLHMRFRGGDFTPQYHPERLDDPCLKAKPSTIFVGSMTDLGGEWTKPEWMENILRIVDYCPDHTFQFLTKNPRNIKKWFTKSRKNVWIGASVENGSHGDRVEAIRSITTVPVRFLSFEPLQGPCDYDLIGIDWILIGAQTNPLRLPDPVWVEKIIGLTRKSGTRVFMKNNLVKLDLPMIQEYPEVTS